MGIILKCAGMRLLLPVLVAASLSFAQWGGGGGGKSLNDYKKISVSGRDVHVYAPSNLKAKSPLLFSFHGMDQDPNYQQSNTHWEEVADTAGFVVVYPRGGTGMSTWDLSGDKDTKWITEIIATMVRDYDIDEKRVYLTGFSMGGMLVYYSMSKIADKIAAFAPCSGTNVISGALKAMRPVPIIHPHGTVDDILYYSQVESFIKNYRDQFHCPSEAEVQENYPNDENSGATMYTWGPCDDGVYIKHLKLPDRGHLPSKAEVSDIWNFMKEYTVDGRISYIDVPTDRDTIFNGSFSDSLDLAGWTLLRVNSSAATLKHTDRAAEIRVYEELTNADDARMIQDGIHFENGLMYRVTFDAYASEAGTFEVDIGKNDNSWVSYLGEPRTFELSTEKSNYEVIFTMNESTDGNGSISFNAGLFVGGIYIDNVVLSKIEEESSSSVSIESSSSSRSSSSSVSVESSCSSTVSASSSSSAPVKSSESKAPGSSNSKNEVSSLLKAPLPLSKEKTYRVYDTKGVFVCELNVFGTGNIQTELNSMRLDKGLYVVKEGRFSKMFIVK